MLILAGFNEGRGASSAIDLESPGRSGTQLETTRCHAYSTNTSHTAPLNWIYSSRHHIACRYAILERESRLGSTIPELKRPAVINGNRPTKKDHFDFKMVVFINLPQDVCASSTLRRMFVDPLRPDHAAASLSNLQADRDEPKLAAEDPPGVFTEQH